METYIATAVPLIVPPPVVPSGGGTGLVRVMVFTLPFYLVIL